MPIADAIPEGTRFIGVLFTANYAPPCLKFMEPLKKFHEAIKDKGFKLIVVNCDRTEQSYAKHLKLYEWCHGVPYDAPQTIIETLEDKACADVVPKLSVFSVSRGFSKFVVNDIKHTILSQADVNTAVNLVLEKIR